MPSIWEHLITSDLFLYESSHVCNKLSNHIVGEGFKAKLSDFGLARGVQENDYYRIAQKTALPVRWMAPESLLYGKFTAASDVWWELLILNVKPVLKMHLW